MINIISGKNKRAKLLVPQKDVRPTSSLKRGAIFSILESHAIKKKGCDFQEEIVEKILNKISSLTVSDVAE